LSDFGIDTGGLNGATIELLVSLLTFIGNIDLNKSGRNLDDNESDMAVVNVTTGYIKN
jgi:hypothetical protein